jgi:hypothetical protein
MILSNKPLIMRMFMHPPESEISTLLLAALKEMGGMVLMLSGMVLMLGVMLLFASRDPERNVAIIDALIAGLCILALTPLVSLYTLDVRSLYPTYLIWGRALVRLALAGVLYYLRPREAHRQPAGHFRRGVYAEGSQTLFIRLRLGCPWFSEISGEYSASVDTECSDFAQAH